MKRLTFAIAFAALWWFLMFSTHTKDLFNFWMLMVIAAVLLSAMAFGFGKIWKRETFRPNLHTVLWGVGSATILWVLFFVGDKLAAQLFDFAKSQVNNVYALREGETPWKIGLLLCLIGPAEELFWRGYIQGELSRRLSPNVGFVIATALYILVHLWSFNLMLLLAAAVVGTTWGLMYRMKCSMSTLILSHTLWDIAIFVLFPIL